MRLGVDFSEHGGALSASTVACWKGHGVDHAVVQYSQRMSQHLDAVKAAGGIEVEAYVYLYWGRSPWNQTPLDRTRAALDMAGNRITRLWLDAEDTTHAFNAQELAQCVRLCEQRGMPTGIYTGRWVWVDRYGNPSGFEHLPLWHAEYQVQEGLPARPDLKPNSFDGFKLYGGWTKPLIWQFQGTCTLCGHQVDLNAVDELAGVPQPPAKPRQSGGTAAIVLEPGAPRAYLWTGRLEWIPSAQVRDELAGALNVAPTVVSPQTFAWLVEQHMAAGGSWPGR